MPIPVSAWDNLKLAIFYATEAQAKLAVFVGTRDTADADNDGLSHPSAIVAVKLARAKLEQAIEELDYCVSNIQAGRIT